MPPGEDAELTRTPGSSGPPTDAGPPRTWGEFRLLGELGRGGFGRVYHAWDPTLTRDIALKVVRLPDASQAAAALREGRMLARVRHRNVVTVYGAQQIGDEIGVWMELIRGRHLSQVIREHGPMGPEEATVIGISLCQALAAVHAAGLIHRDVKANNVMRESGGRIVLMDFGTGRESESALVGDLAGTPVYMAPEVLDGGSASTQSDLYSVGVLLYFVVTGEYPVAGRSLLDLTLAHRRGERKLLADRRPDLPDGFIRAVERALAPDPANRPTSAGAMMRDLTGALPGPIAPEPRGLDGPMSDPWTPSTTPIHTPRSITPATVPAPAPVGRWAGVAVATFLSVGTFGFLTTTAFNSSLERDATFSTDSAVDWWIFGFRSLVGPLLLSALVVLAGRLAVTVWHVLLRVVPPLRRTTQQATGALVRMAPHVGAESSAELSQWLVALHVGALVFIGLRFRGLIQAVINPGWVGPDLLRHLDPDSLTPAFYRAALTLVLVGAAR
jgi:serine/threonine-protein kinase